MIWGRAGNPDRAQPFVEHLEDLRKTIVRCVLLLGAGMAVAAPLAPHILRVVKLPLAWAGADPRSFLRVMRIAGGLTLTMRVVFWGGLLISLPFMALAVGSFVVPALKEREKKVLYRLGAFAVFLFAAGVAMGYFLTLPLAIRMIFQINDWLGVACEFVEMGDYVLFVLQLLLAFGLAFELPVIVVILGRLGLIHSEQLRRYRRHVIVGLLMVAMVLTPPDVLSQILLGAPLIVFYEICIWIVYFGEKADRRRDGKQP